MKFSRRGVLIGCLVGLIGVLGFVYWNIYIGVEQTLEWDLAMQSRVSYSPDEGSVHVRGLCFHSSYGVARTVVSRDGSDMLLEVVISKSALDSGGTFDETLDVDSDAEGPVNRVLLGNERTVIWERQ